MNKNTHIISELKTFFHKNDCNKAINCIMTTIRHFNLRSSCIGVEKRHNCKLSCLQVLELLLVFPFFMVKNSFQYHHSGLSKFFSCQKDMFYRFMEQDNIDWRKLVYLVSIRLLNRISSRKDSKESLQCLIIDKSVRYSRKLNCHYAYIDAEYANRKIRIFFCKRGRKGTWNAFLSTTKIVIL